MSLRRREISLASSRSWTTIISLTGDAIFTQRAICQAIIDGGGHYFFTVKGNQPALKADIEQAFRPFSPLGGMVCSG